jgi:polyvinyl alcohol dehydrogenase (cytochrome)
LEVKLIFVLAAVAAVAQTPEATFQSRCATCHSAGNLMGAPPPETLRKMSSKAILAALETGRMSSIGAGLTAAERETVAKIGTSETSVSTAKCSGSPRSNGEWNGWADAANTRFTKAAGLTAQTTPKLKLKWAFGFPGATTAFGSPTVVDGRVFVGDANGGVYALDARTGCTYWTYTAMAGVRAAPVIGGKSVYFGDLRGNVYAVNVSTGALLWKTRADDHPMAVITGSPKLDAGRLYVPVSGRDESIAAINPSYECCTFRGSVVALDAATGKRIWQAYTVRDEPKVTGQNAKGTKTWGPSGAVPWSSPTLDLQKRVLYIGTGVNYSNPPTDTSDAIIAIDMDSGRLLWSRQLTAADSYNFACGAEDKTNCPSSITTSATRPFFVTAFSSPATRAAPSTRSTRINRASCSGSRRSLQAASTAVSCGAPQVTIKASATSASPTSPPASPKPAAA